MAASRGQKANRTLRERLLIDLVFDGPDADQSQVVTSTGQFDTSIGGIRAPPAHIAGLWAKVLEPGHGQGPRPRRWWAPFGANPRGQCLWANPSWLSGPAY